MSEPSAAQSPNLPARSASTRRPSLKARLLLLLVSCGLGLLLAEAALRVAGVAYPQPYEPDQWCGSRLKPGLRGYWSKEGAAAFAINSFGFRDREWTINKPERCLRIAVLGDSYIEAFQVADDAKFGSMLERELNASELPDVDRVEVLSFGVSGFGTAQELLVLQHYVWQFQPDIVLLAFLPANDLRNNSPALEPTQLRPFFQIVDDQLAPDFSFRNNPAYQYALTDSCRFKSRLINASRILQVVQAFRTGDAGVRRAAEAEITRDRIGLDDQCFLEPTDPDWQSAWQLAERLIEEIHRDVAEHRALLAVAIVTSGIQVTPDAARRADYLQRLGVDNLDYSNKRIERLGARLDFPVIRLSDPLLKYATEHGVAPHGFANTAPGEGHWNETGHREAARACAEQIRNQWIQSRGE